MAKKSIRKQLNELPDITQDELDRIVKERAGNHYSNSLRVVSRQILKSPDASPKISISTSTPNQVQQYLEKWTDKYLAGYNGRASQRRSNPIGTVHDSAVDYIIRARIDSDNDDLEKIKFAHRLAMAAENIGGNLLEEYLSIELAKYGWHCCWGETMRAIDFCTENGLLLQIKTSDNSENSSSSAVRNGTLIQKWFRRKSKSGATNWPALNQLVGIENEQELLTEEKYQEFVQQTISDNPDAMFIEDENPWR